MLVLQLFSPGVSLLEFLPTHSAPRWLPHEITSRNGGPLVPGQVERHSLFRDKHERRSVFDERGSTPQNGGSTQVFSRTGQKVGGKTPRTLRDVTRIEVPSHSRLLTQQTTTRLPPVALANSKEENESAESRDGGAVEDLAMY